MNEIIKITNYRELIKLIYAKYEICNVLIDFHNRKKWLASKNITATLIPSEKQSVYRDFSARKGEFIRRNDDNSILYVCNAHTRYEYFIRNEPEWFPAFSNNDISDYICRELEIIIYNENSDLLIDNGKARTDYNYPNIYCHAPYKEIQNNLHGELDEKDNRIISVTKNHILPNPFIIKNRNDGGYDLFDKDTEILKYVCNIGKRYEYYFKGEFHKIIPSSQWDDNDLLIYLKPDKENCYIPVITMINPSNNPYIIKQREDGGVDLLSKKDNSLKYICNIGKRFYYEPCENKIIEMNDEHIC
jgi:hypothetical protein